MGTSYKAEQDADTPLARWRFEETSGTTFADDVGSATATISGSVTPGSVASNRPAYGRGGDFAGGHATVTGASAWLPQTIELLVTFDTVPSTSSTARPAVFQHDGASSAPIPLALGYCIDGKSGERGRLGFGYWTPSSWKRISFGSGNIVPGVRYHIVGTYDGSGTLRLYLDGNLFATGSGFTVRGTPSGVSGTVNIGRRYDGTAQIDGTIWDLAIYNGELSAGRVADHYAATLQPEGLEVSGGGDLYVDGAEGSGDIESTWTLTGGGLLKFRATPLDPVTPGLAVFAAHPGDGYGAESSSPWFITDSVPEGTTITGTDHSTWVYTPGGQVERVIGSTRMTRTDTDLIALAAACDPGISNPTEWGPSWRGPWQADQQDWDIHAGAGAWPLSIRDSQNLYIAWQRTGATVTVAADATLYWSNLVVMHRRYNYAGQPEPPIPSVTVRELVHDLVGRGFSSRVEFDPERVAPGTPWRSRVGHAAWWNGASAREVLAYAEQYAPGMWWTVEEPGSTGLPRFVVGRWDGPARYVFRRADVELSGGANDLANRCLVKYIGTTYGNSKTVWVAEVRANVRGLAEAGVVRTMQLDLTSEGLMSPDIARARAVAALRTAAQSSTAGRVTVTRPVYDMVQGRMVEPWEIEGGSPVVVADAPLAFSRSTSLAESVGADGVSVFRARSVAYEASSNTATVSLDGGSRSLIGRFRTEATPRRYDLSTVRG